MEPKGRYAAVVSAEGLLRLYDLHVCRAQRQALHPMKLRVIPISAEATEAAAAAAEAPTAMMSFALPTALSKPPSKALLDAVFPPAAGRGTAWVEDDEEGMRPTTPPVTSGPAPSRKAKLTSGRRGPFAGVARAAPASSHAAASFPLPSGQVGSGSLCTACSPGHPPHRVRCIVYWCSPGHPPHRKPGVLSLIQRGVVFSGGDPAFRPRWAMGWGPPRARPTCWWRTPATRPRWTP